MSMNVTLTGIKKDGSGNKTELTDSSGNPAGNIIVSTPSGTNADGSSDIATITTNSTGTSFSLGSGSKTFQFSTVADAAQAYTSTAILMVSNVDTANVFVEAGRVVMSGTGTTPDVGGIALDAFWAYARIDTTGMTGTGVTTTVVMGG